jgi:hypothetical protein
MQEQYAEIPHLVGPWQPELGTTIAQLYEQLGDKQRALTWYLEVLNKSPLNPKAVDGKQRLKPNS